MGAKIEVLLRARRGMKDKTFAFEGESLKDIASEIENPDGTIYEFFHDNTEADIKAYAFQGVMYKKSDENMSIIGCED